MRLIPRLVAAELAFDQLDERGLTGSPSEVLEAFV
jgi:hypothetical protein